MATTETVALLFLVFCTFIADPENSLEYSFFGVVTIAAISFFRYEKNRTLFFKAYFTAAWVVILQSLFQIIIVYFGLLEFFQPAPYRFSSNGLFYPAVGTILSPQWSDFRVAGYFTEANRLCYFLVPILFAVVKSSIKSKLLFTLLCIFVIGFTGSVVGISVAVLGCFFLFRQRLFLLGLSGLAMIPIIWNLGRLAEFFGRYKSLSIRSNELYDVLQFVTANPSGLLFSDKSIEYVGGIGTAFGYWAIVGGIPGFIISLVFFIAFQIRVIACLKNATGWEKGLFIGIGCYTIYQSFMGIFLEFLFCAVLSFTLASKAPKEQGI